MPTTAADAALLASLAGRTLFKAVLVPTAYGIGYNLLLTFDDGRSILVRPNGHCDSCGVYLSTVGIKHPPGGGEP
jgi:hypothetical protein